MALPRSSINLFSSLVKTSADGSAFCPTLGPYNWCAEELAVIVDVFEMPFNQKKLYRVLLTRGGTGWVWDDVIDVVREGSCV